MLTEFRSVRDVWEQLPTEADARRFLEETIWGETPICPHCKFEGAWAIIGPSARRGLYQCRACRGQFTVTTKTPFHATKLDLRIWIAGMFLVITSSKGISSVVLARLLGITQKTAWKMGHAIREMMDERGKRSSERLTGIVEVDETFVGGKPKYRKGVKNKRGKGTKKPQILVAVQRDGEARATRIENARAKTIHPVVKDWVDPSRRR
jgi:transposase-like protein